MKASTLQILALAATFLFAVYIIIAYSLPFNYYIRIDEYKALDVCVGDAAVTYMSKREPRWGMKADVYAQIVKFEDIEYTETTIVRGSIEKPITYGYEPETYKVLYNTTWFYVGDNIYLWPEEGVYGAQEWVTIYPLPFVEIKRFYPADETKFNVINCDTK